MPCSLELVQMVSQVWAQLDTIPVTVSQTCHSDGGGRQL